MNPKMLDEHLLVSPQITPDDVDTAADAGVTTIINNRPDGEEASQPSSAEIAARAAARGLAYHHIPVSGGTFDDRSVSAFDAALAGATGKTLAFCRTGTRSTTLWSLVISGFLRFG